MPTTSRVSGRRPKDNLWPNLGPGLLPLRGPSEADDKKPKEEEEEGDELDMELIIPSIYRPYVPQPRYCVILARATN